MDLRYEARNVEQYLGNKNKIDEWFEKRTLGLSNVASAILKQRWARMEKLFSSKERVQRIVADICQDMDTKRALAGGYGNAMLVADSIYQACRYWEVFQETTLKGYCAVVTSYGAEPVSYTHLDVYKRQMSAHRKRNLEQWETLNKSKLKP